MKEYCAKEVVCPFYTKEMGLLIRCEGFCKTNSIFLSFRTKEHKKRHKKEHCNSMEGYLFCPLYAIINKQYEEGEDG